MSFLGITGLVNFVTSTILGIFILFKNPQKNLRNTYFLLNASVAIFSLGYFFWQMSTDLISATIWFKVLTVGIILINVFFIHFVFVYVGIAKRKKYELGIYYLISLVFIFLNINSQLYTSMEPRHGMGFWPNPTVFFDVYLIFWFFLCFYGFGWFLKSYYDSFGFQREQRKYLTLGAAVGFIGGASNWPMWYDVYFPPYVNFFISIYVLLIAYAIIKYRLMDIKILLTRAGIFLILYTVILGIPFFMGYQTDFGFESFLLIFVFATLGPVIYQYLQKKAEDVLLGKQRTYQNMFLQAGKEFLREKDLNRILKIIVNGVKYQILVEYAAIFLLDQDSGVYKLKYIKGEHSFPEGFSFAAADDLIILLQKDRRIISLEEIPNYINKYTMTPVQLIVPSFMDDKMLGFLILGEKMDKTFYTNDDIQTFDIISHQAALAIENCLYYEEKERFQERIFQNEKSAFIGGMAEGVAHQINNRLNHFSLAAAEIEMLIKKYQNDFPAPVRENPPIKETFESLQTISEQLIDNVKRTNGVIKGVLNYANLTRRDDDIAEIFFNEIIDAAIDLAQIKHEIEEFPIQVDVVGSSNILYGKMTQLLESIFNILDNAYEAIEEKRMFKLNEEERRNFSPRISIKLVQKDNVSRIEISDNGIGIREEDYKKIFAPYYTTKSSFKTTSSSGIGLYEVSRFIQENHKGKIWFESKYLEGTTFFLEIPRIIF
ncbi:MAG: hypothetical protein CVV44_23425 [Spirochaetae bacterium HGW-Spirochaetae-1]|jgi:signal transduction histidine kinase|nr:MAG: hypothetical protein CVV44_23425 [Spirochaetae bacterium HGW-Spirochaetae-1]